MPHTCLSYHLLFISTAGRNTTPISEVTINILLWKENVRRLTILSCMPTSAVLPTPSLSSLSEEGMRRKKKAGGCNIKLLHVMSHEAIPEKWRENNGEKKKRSMAGMNYLEKEEERHVILWGRRQLLFKMACTVIILYAWNQLPSLITTACHLWQWRVRRAFAYDMISIYYVPITLYTWPLSAALPEKEESDRHAPISCLSHLHYYLISAWEGEALCPTACLPTCLHTLYILTLWYVLRRKMKKERRGKRYHLSEEKEEEMKERKKEEAEKMKKKKHITVYVLKKYEEEAYKYRREKRHKPIYLRERREQQKKAEKAEEKEACVVINQYISSASTTCLPLLRLCRRLCCWHPSLSSTLPPACLCCLPLLAFLIIREMSWLEKRRKSCMSTYLPRDSEEASLWEGKKEGREGRSHPVGWREGYLSPGRAGRAAIYEGMCMFAPYGKSSFSVPPLPLIWEKRKAVNKRENVCHLGQRKLSCGEKSLLKWEAGKSGRKMREIYAWKEKKKEGGRLAGSPLCGLRLMWHQHAPGCACLSALEENLIF